MADPSFTAVSRHFPTVSYLQHPRRHFDMSFVVHCAKNGSLFDLQACQPVQCNPMPAVKYISPMIQVGYVFQQNLVLQCMDGYSDEATAGYDTSLSSSCSNASWTLGNCRLLAFGSFSSRSNGVASPTSAFTRHFDSEIDFAGSQGFRTTVTEL